MQRILAEHYRPGAARRPELTFDQLLLVMDRQDLAAAQQRLKACHGLRVVKWWWPSPWLATAQPVTYLPLYLAESTPPARFQMMSALLLRTDIAQGEGEARNVPAGDSCTAQISIRKTVPTSMPLVCRWRSRPQRHELTCPYSITSSARASSVGGMLRSIALPVLPKRETVGTWCCCPTEVIP